MESLRAHMVGPIASKKSLDIKRICKALGIDVSKFLSGGSTK